MAGLLQGKEDQVLGLNNALEFGACPRPISWGRVEEWRE